MSRVAKAWLWWGAGLLSVTAVVACFNVWYAVALIFSFLYGEYAIGYWLKLGFSLTSASALVIVPSIIDLYWQFQIAEQSFVPLIAKFLGLQRKERHIDENSELYRFIKKSPYLAMPLLGFPTFGIWTGITISKIFRLNGKAVFILLAIGNSTKMILSGLGFVVAGTVLWTIALSLLTICVVYFGGKLTTNGRKAKAS